MFALLEKRAKCVATHRHHGTPSCNSQASMTLVMAWHSLRQSMISSTYPSPIASHRKADLIVHLAGLILTLGMGCALLFNTIGGLETKTTIAVVVYLLCILTSNLASCTYHFAPWHEHRTFLRRIDHSAIYPSIVGTFTPFFVQAGTTWTFTLLCVCWALTAVAIWKKITDKNVKSKWSTASYLGLGALGLCALPDLTNTPIETLWYIIAGATCYVIGTMFYARKTMPFRYAIWHICVNFGGVFMFVGIWTALL